MASAMDLTTDLILSDSQGEGEGERYRYSDGVRDAGGRVRRETRFRAERDGEKFGPRERKSSQ